MNSQVNFRNESFGMSMSRDMFAGWLATSKSSRDIVDAFRVLDDNYMEVPLSFSTHPQTIIAESLNKFILECHQHGFCANFISKAFDFIDLGNDKQGPQVLTRTKLSAGFFVWLATVVVACVVFALEHLVHYLKNKDYVSKLQEIKPNSKHRLTKCSSRFLMRLKAKVTTSMKYQSYHFSEKLKAFSAYRGKTNATR